MDIERKAAAFDRLEAMATTGPVLITQIDGYGVGIVWNCSVVIGGKLVDAVHSRGDVVIGGGHDGN
jgi:hypothetical protein